MTDIQIGDHVRVIHDTPYGAREGEEFTVTHISPPLKPEGAYAGGKGFAGGVWLTDLELADRAGEQVERHIAHINSLDAVIRKRNATIERLQTQLAEYAAEIEKLKVGASEWLELGRGLGHDDRDFEARLTGAVFRSPIAADITANILRDLQKRIGEANAAKGFHEEGDILRRSQVIAYTNNISEGEQGTNYANTAAALRSYATARLALITTEVAEAIEEVRTGHAVDETYYVAKGAFEVDGEMQDLEVPATALSDPEDEDRDYSVAQLGEGPHKPEGVPSEVADVVIRAFDFAHEFGIDLAAMIDEKLRFNATRPHKHGKVM